MEGVLDEPHDEFIHLASSMLRFNQTKFCQTFPQVYSFKIDYLAHKFILSQSWRTGLFVNDPGKFIYAIEQTTGVNKLYCDETAEDSRT